MITPKKFVFSSTILFSMILAFIPLASNSAPVILDRLKNELPKAEIYKLISFASKHYHKEVAEIGQAICLKPKLNRYITIDFKSKKITNSLFELYSATFYYKGWAETPIEDEDKKYHKGNWYTSGKLSSLKQKRFSLSSVDVFIDPDTDGIPDEEILKLLIAIQNNDYVISLDTESLNLVKEYKIESEAFFRPSTKIQQITDITHGKDGVYEVGLIPYKCEKVMRNIRFVFKNNHFELISFVDAYPRIGMPVD